MLRTQFVLIALLFSSATYGQLSWGVKAGLNVNKIIFKDLPESVDDGNQVNISYHVGFFGEFAIGEKFFVTPELQFSQRGASGGSSGFRINLNYIEMPLLLSFSPVKRIRLDLGPNVALRVSTVLKSSNGQKATGDYFDRFDFGLTTGIRVSVSERISIIGRYYHGLTSIDETYYRDANNNPVAEVKTFNRNGQLGLSYRFGQPNKS